MFDVIGIICDLFDHPGDGGSHGFAQYRSTGFADGRQLAEGPCFRTVRPELIHKKSVRQHDQVHVPGLALAVAQLTISHAQLLLSVPVEGRRAGPAIFVNQEDSHYVPGDAVGYQNLAGFFVSFFVPNNDDPYFVVDSGYMQAHGEVPLLLVSAMEGFAALGIDLGGQFVGADYFALPLQLAIELQVADIAARPAETIFFGMNVVQYLGIGEIAVEGEIPGNFTFDSYFTNAEILNHIHSKKDRFGRPRGYVGDLKFNRKLEWKGKIIRADELAAEIDPESRKSFHRGHKQQWYFTVCLHIPGVNHKVRIVIIWDKKRDKEPCKILITNRVAWDVVRILLVYKYRWTGTETFHRDGKQELGMGDCQLRDGQGQTRHMYLVMLAYTLLMDQLGPNRAKTWALRKLTTIGEACRAVLRETMRSTIAWVIEQGTDYAYDIEHITVRLGLT